jgi:solute carrier family 25 carnitine/acylcarnitine transporter 20/29
MEGIKSRLQIQYSTAKAAATATVGGAAVAPVTHYAGPIDCARQVIQKLGVFNGLYRGWAAVALCRMSNWSYFGSYEYFKQKLSPPSAAGQAPRKLSMGAAVLAGGGAGICYWLSCYPMDVIKARLLAQPDVSPPKYRGIVHVAREIYRLEGGKAFFKGFTPCILRAFPANAAAFTAFEVMMSILPP